jgi:hypothetical protein
MPRLTRFAAIRLELGLDRPIPIQFIEYIGRVLRGDLGRSIISNKMVSEELALTIGPTVELMLGAMLIAVPLGLALGTLAAVKRGTLPDRLIMAISVAGRFDAGVLHRPDPDPVCRLQVGDAALHRPHRPGVGRRPAQPDPAGSDPGRGPDRPDSRG